MKQLFSYINPLNAVKLVRPRQNIQNADTQFEIIDVEYYDPEYQPTFDRYTNQIEYEPFDGGNMQLQEIQAIYLGRFDQLQETQQRESIYTEYVVEPNDTLFGIELKFNISISQAKILDLNQISENLIVPGMQLKIPVLQAPHYPQLLQETSEQIEFKSYLGRNLMDEIMIKGNTKKCNPNLSHKYSTTKDPVQYVTNQLSVSGTLTINEDIILFDPIYNHKNIQNTDFQQQNGQNLIKYQACFCLKDVVKVTSIILPQRVSTVQKQNFRDLILRLVLKNVGKRKLSSQVNSGDICVHFRLNEEGQNFLQLSSQLEEMCTYINQIIQNYNIREEEKSADIINNDDLTHVPFYEVSRLDDDDTMILLMERCNLIWGGSNFVPIMLQPSNAIKPQNFIQIISYIPTFFKQSNWRLLYSNLTHGSSYTSFLNASESHSPLILLIKDFDGYVFGSYISTTIHSNTKFYGSGETFIFTYKNEDQIAVYEWTEKNNDFIYCDRDGFAIGCGEKFGLYINESLMSGYSSQCDTFQNELLSKQGNFQIEVLELWTLEHE